MKRELAFTKLEALGNDFVLIDAREGAFAPLPATVARLGDRRLGIGFDQLLILRPASRPDRHVAVEIFNQDGSTAEQCGNGMRAVALWLHDRGELSESARLETAAGPVDVRFESPDHITATLPPPSEAAPAGAELPAERPWQESRAGRDYPVDFVSMGNPHLILDLEQPADVALVESLGEVLTHHPGLPEGANVNFAHVESRHLIDLSVYERGAGPTRACGSGACATAASLIRRGQVDSPVEIRQPGGTLVIHWDGGPKPVYMTGPARIVFHGRIDIEPTINP
ncbi:diaminopimelate epimerase [Wenzhouxiangella marina]|uniref:Diaminopimelate epimerase n=1 Tax=Wenzhouxiangella marina TaxID=1579979 RepID=A0A0K0XXE5_9GAMM|nr:diaminopimelate epimerase [Wenzhouxiangella marina]AKS42302.1 hypothetical protein WM2015_1936 [Wenzhouxiangella marina]MBB6085925.1 diaminopimelate epimerase [Wenzhouxiangella marina]